MFTNVYFNKNKNEDIIIHQNSNIYKDALPMANK